MNRYYLFKADVISYFSFKPTSIKRFPRFCKFSSALLVVSVVHYSMLILLYITVSFPLPFSCPDRLFECELKFFGW